MLHISYTFSKVKVWKWISFLCQLLIEDRPPHVLTHLLFTYTCIICCIPTDGCFANICKLSFPLVYNKSLLMFHNSTWYMHRLNQKTLFSHIKKWHVHISVDGIRNYYDWWPPTVRGLTTSIISEWSFPCWAFTSVALWLNRMLNIKTIHCILIPIRKYNPVYLPVQAIESSSQSVRHRSLPRFHI